MPFDPGLTPGQEISNYDICRIFQCSLQGGMRRSNSTDTLVLTSDPKMPLYQDEWHGDVFHYTGMGKSGDQELDFQQNKTLSESNTNGVDVFLFTKLKPDQYRFEGRAKLADKPYQDVQEGEDRRNRKVWVFPTRVIDTLSDHEWKELEERTEREARRLSDDEVKRRASRVQGPPTYRSVSGSRQPMRDKNVKEYVKRRASGKCELCNEDAPFLDAGRQPYLVEHHIIWLADGGDDTSDNAVALCPNCHAKMHVLDLEEDKLVLRDRTMQG